MDNASSIKLIKKTRRRRGNKHVIKLSRLAGKGKRVNISGMSLLQSPPSLIHLINAHMSVRTCSQLYIFTSSRLPPNAHMILYARSTHFFPAALARFPAPFKRHVINPTTYICSTWKPMYECSYTFFQVIFCF